MVEQRGSGDESGHDPVGSDRADDPSRVDGERDAPATAGEGTELIDDNLADKDQDGADADAPSAASETEPDSEYDGSDAAQQYETAEDDSGAEVLAFPAHPENVEPDDSEFDDTEFDDTDLTDADLADGAKAEAVDLAAVQADDALLTALGGTDPEVDTAATGEHSGGPALEALLVSWRRDVDAAPIAELVDVDTAASTIAEARRPVRRRRPWHLVPVASAAAVLMIAFTGVGLAAKDALPGDMLWGVAKVLYHDHARAAQAASLAQVQLDEASAAWDRGNRDAAESALSRANDRIHNVDPGHDGWSDLRAAHESLAAKFEQNPDGIEGSTSPPVSETEQPNLPPPSQPSPSVPPTDPTDEPTTSPNPTDEPTETTSPTDHPTDTPGEPSDGGTTWSDPGSGGLFPPDDPPSSP